MEYLNGISEKYGNKAASVLKHLQSALGTGWEDDLYGLKLKILSNDSSNLLDSLLYGACQMMELLRKLEVKKPRDDLVEQVVTENGMGRENNLMVFGDWNKKDNYDQEIDKVLNHLGVKDTAYETKIVCGNDQKCASKKVVVKVKFEDSKPVVDALSSAKRLTSFKVNEVAIDKDRSFEERIKLRATVKQLRLKIKEEPWFHWIIRDYKVINLGVRRKGKHQDKVDPTCMSDTILSNESSVSKSDSDESVNEYAKMVMSIRADELHWTDDSPSDSDAKIPMVMSIRADELHSTDDSPSDSDAKIPMVMSIRADELYCTDDSRSDFGSNFDSFDSKDPEIFQLLRGNSHYSG